MKKIYIGGELGLKGVETGIISQANFKIAIIRGEATLSANLHHSRYRKCGLMLRIERFSLASDVERTVTSSRKQGQIACRCCNRHSDE